MIKTNKMAKYFNDVDILCNLEPIKKIKVGGILPQLYNFGKNVVQEIKKNCKTVLLGKPDLNFVSK